MHCKSVIFLQKETRVFIRRQEASNYVSLLLNEVITFCQLEGPVFFVIFSSFLLH